MSVDEVRREHPMRRVLEGIFATVTSGLILWWVTVPGPRQAAMSQPVPPSAERPEDRAVYSIPAETPPISPPLAAAEMREEPLPAASVNLSALSPATGSAVAMAAPTSTALPYSPPLPPILLYENFSHHREGEAADWGLNATVKLGLDRRKWLAPCGDGAHPVGRSIRLPNQFYFECRYAAQMSDVTRGLFGWWKEPVASTIALVDDKGVKYTIEWSIGCGNDPMKLDLLGSSLYAKKYYHTIKLPGGATNEVVVAQPTGMLRINRDNGLVKVLVDGQIVANGTIGQMGQLVGFEINVLKAKSGTLFFTDVKIAR